MSHDRVTLAESDNMLAKFPTSMFISSTRDMSLSAVIHTHRQFVRLGIKADYGKDWNIFLLRLLSGRILRFFRLTKEKTLS